MSCTHMDNRQSYCECARMIERLIRCNRPNRSGHVTVDCSGGCRCRVPNLCPVCCKCRCICTCRRWRDCDFDRDFRDCDRDRDRDRDCDFDCDFNRDRDRDRDCGCNRDRDRDRDCGCGRDRDFDRDCDFDCDFNRDRDRCRDRDFDRDCDIDCDFNRDRDRDCGCRDRDFDRDCDCRDRDCRNRFSVQISFPFAGSFVTAPVVVSGTARPNSRLLIALDNVSLGHTIVDAQGFWNVTIETLSPGSHSILAIDESSDRDCDDEQEVRFWVNAS